MNSQEFNDFMNTEESQKNLEVYLKNIDVQKKYIFPIVDSKVNTAVESFRKNQGLDDFLPRIEQIEKGLDAKDAEIKKTKLDNYLFKSSTTKGVPYELLKDFPFSNEQEIDAKIESYKRETDALRINEVNNLMASRKFTPSGSASIKSRTNINGLSQKEIEALEFEGRLDAMIGN